MADDVITSAGSADGARFATDDDGTRHWPYTKVAWGADNEYFKASTATPVPVVQTGTHTVVVTGVATAANQSTIIGHVDGIETLIGTTNSTLTTIDGRVDGIEALLTTANGYQDGIETLLTAIDGHVDGIEGTQASIVTAVQKIDDPVLVDDAAFTPATSSVMMAGFEADEGSTDSVDEGDAGAARMTLDRKVITNPQPHTAGGLSIARDIDLDNSTLTVVKNAPGQLYGWDITNTSTATVFVKFYDATSGTLGTGTPVMTIGIPGNATDDTLASKALAFGITFATGICVGAGTGVADNDTADPGANAVVANIYYK